MSYNDDEKNLTNSINKVNINSQSFLFVMEKLQDFS